MCSSTKAILHLLIAFIPPILPSYVFANETHLYNPIWTEYGEMILVSPFHSKDGKILFEIFENFYDFIILLPLIIEIYGVLLFICVKYFVGIALNLIDR